MTDARITASLAKLNDSPLHLGYTLPKLAAAFNRVTVSTSWKEVINKQFPTVLTRAEKSAIAASVGFYTGENPVITDNYFGTRVAGRGYYKVIGA